MNMLYVFCCFSFFITIRIAYRRPSAVGGQPGT